MAIVKKDNSHNPFKVDEGMYKAVIASIDEKEGNNGPYLLWSFKILHPIIDGEQVAEPMNVAGFTPLIVQDDTKLDKWLKACGTNVAEDGDEFDTEDLIGKKIQVLVENKSSKKNGQERSQVTKLLRAPSAPASQPEAAPPKKQQTKPQGAPPKAAPKKPPQAEEDVVEEMEDPVEDPPPRKKAAVQPQKSKARATEPEEESEGEGETRPDIGDMWDFGDDTP